MTTRQVIAMERAARVRELLADGKRLKVAAWEAGCAYRTARRYRKSWV